MMFLTKIIQLKNINYHDFYCASVLYVVLELKPTRNCLMLVLKLGLVKESALAILVLPEVTQLTVGIFWTRSVKHLRVGPDPLVGDPLGSNHDGTAAMSCPVIITASFVHIPPDHQGSFSWFDIGANDGEHRVTTGLDVTEVAHELE